ncbi:unnamed protein product [Ectocarpus fasciculatus]
MEGNTPCTSELTRLQNNVGFKLRGQNNVEGVYLAGFRLVTFFFASLGRRLKAFVDCQEQGERGAKRSLFRNRNYVDDDDLFLNKKGPRESERARACDACTQSVAVVRARVLPKFGARANGT